MRAREMGAHVNGVPMRYVFPARVTYTRPVALAVEVDGHTYSFPLYLREELEKRFPGHTIEVVREEYEVAKRDRY